MDRIFANRKTKETFKLIPNSLSLDDMKLTGKFLGLNDKVETMIINDLQEITGE